MYSRLAATKKKPSNQRLRKAIILVSLNRVVFFNKDITNNSSALDEDCPFLVLMPFRKCLKLLWGGGGLHDRFRLPWLQKTITRQREILVTTLPTKQGSTDYKNVIFCYLNFSKGVLKLGYLKDSYFAAHSVDTAIS